MIADFIKQWELNKNKLEQYFKETRQGEYSSYESIVKKVFEICVPEPKWNLNRMTVIDDGDYQGTQIFIIPIDTYQPDSDEYIVTNSYYGSCSGCDTLLAISEYEDGLPSETQVQGYMSIALHLIQKTKWLYEN